MNKIKFALFTDLHYDHIPDGRQRIESFITNIKDEDVNFVIELGDFCSPKEENHVLMDMLDSIGKPHYHLIGNHDSDLFPKEKVMNFLKMDNSYYSFKCGGVRFIALDTCYIKTNNGYEPYCNKNYDKTKDIYPILPDYEFKWLEHQLTDDSEYFIIFSHHSFENEFAKRGVYNRDDVKKLIDKVNNTGKKVLLCINGHDHGDSLKKIGQTYYFGLNSMSYIWFGPQFEHFCYSDEIHKQYPSLKDMVLYQEGLYSIITITENGEVAIQGMNGHYQNISPKDLGIGDVWNGRSISPIISSLKEKSVNITKKD
ncbi:metallophosphoesterase family protein [Clostridium estertheticum]|uniref:Metallophosphoesterase n=1 Tax=Clostridium estertheticum TaxID=238834 RepID=A0A7Y3WS35_9CLOT|nr:metallophosphoesterase [Clostridium estertheticum]NNU75736.1 metallophosphoesterase [Clostridium estertheticum]WBL46424.1 metallophosphoesterase [Clostridium estertheticum]